MEKSQTLTELTKAVIKVMAEVKGIEKNMTIGTGGNAYKGVSDKDVKKAIGDSMERNGLACFPIEIVEDTQLSEWDEPDQYAKVAGATRHKQQIFTKVGTTYLLSHVSGEYITICGYGHGVDTQDKAAGKATTYALKNALLYTFLIPTGSIDDADAVHSDDIQTKPLEAKLTPTRRITPPINKPMEPLNTDLDEALSDAMLKAELCDDLKKLESVWKAYPQLHGNEKFIKCVQSVKKSITQNRP